uniref:NADH dehydrogenase subunit 4L n=1 Tax=Cardita variegata TaxID=740991 RepID=UPI00286AD29F|nr:NADH dehydrogenase subunit 4L [Cardita variegata]WLW42340.1 NADH dehydrogenase subunit 4L [Cardita variegata]
MMFFNFCLIFISLFFFLVFGVSKSDMSYLSLLIYVESFAVSCFAFLVFGMSGVSALIFLVFAACESAWGISILVNLVRIKGNDYVRSFFSTTF